MVQSGSEIDQLSRDFATLELHVYSQDEAITEITSFYSRMHPEDTVYVGYPPSTAWPHITPGHLLLDPLLWMGSVLWDIRRLLVTGYSDENAYANTSSQSEDNPDSYSGDTDDEEIMPDHIVEIAHAGNRHNYNVYLDTKRSVVIWCVKDEEHLPRDDEHGNGFAAADANSLDTGKEYPEGSWYTMPKYKIKSFFEMCKEQYRILN